MQRKTLKNIDDYYLYSSLQNRSMQVHVISYLKNKQLQGFLLKWEKSVKNFQRTDFLDVAPNVDYIHYVNVALKKPYAR